MTTLAETTSTETARQNLSVCVLDSDLEQVAQTERHLKNVGFTAFGTTDPQEALRRIRAGECRVILVDYKLSTMDGMAFLGKTLQYDPGMHVILVTGLYAVDSAIDAIKRGAADYLSKPLDYPRLEKTLDDLAALHSQRSEIRDLEAKLFDNMQFQGIVGKSPAMLDVFDLAKKVARHYSNVLITGPTGSGKELVARALHALSPVSQERFAVCNCSAVADTLLDSHLFGHMRGSFTGANETRAGLFEFANGGTVLLDEVGETASPMQAKLLRVIQNREIQRVGSPEVKHVQVRVIAATNRDLRAEVMVGRFREDLFYRLNSIEIRVPGLAERPEDIPLLVQHFLKKYSQAYARPFHGLSRRAQLALLRYDWPGNVRELDNVISSAAITASADFIDVADLPEHLQKPQQHLGSAGQAWRPLPLDEVRRMHMQKVLEMCHGNRVRTAQMLGIGRTSLYRFLKRTNQASKAEQGVALSA
jgi:two-component system response regulator HydG